MLPIAICAVAVIGASCPSISQFCLYADAGMHTQNCTGKQGLLNENEC